MRRIKCGVCGGDLRTVATVRGENGAIYRKRVCKTCEGVTYAVETPATRYEFSAVMQAYVKKRKELMKDDSRTISKAH